MAKLPECDPEVWNNGEQLCWIVELPKEEVEEVVKAIAALSSQRVDWHYCGGRARVLFLGDEERVRQAYEALVPEIGRRMRVSIEAVHAKARS